MFNFVFCKNSILNPILPSVCILIITTPIDLYRAKKVTFFKKLEIQIFMSIFDFSSKNYKFWWVYRLCFNKVHQFMIFSSIIKNAAETGKSTLYSIRAWNSNFSKTLEFKWLKSHDFIFSCFDSGMPTYLKMNLINIHHV